MPHNPQDDFKFDFDDLLDRHDLLVDADGEGASEGEFTGKPISHLRGTAIPETKKIDERSASERIEDLFQRFAARRRIMRGILDFVLTPQCSDALKEKVKQLQEHDFSVYDSASYTEIMLQAGAIERVDAVGNPFDKDAEQLPDVVEVNGVKFYRPTDGKQVFWVISAAGREYVGRDDPESRFASLIAEEHVYLSIYQQIIEECAREGGCDTPTLSSMVDSDPLVQKPRYYVAHFLEQLEKCDAIRWEGMWTATDIGRTLLDGVCESVGNLSVEGGE